MKLTVKQWRQVRGLSQKELAREIGISEAAYQTKETGHRDFKSKELVKICETLKISFEKDLEF